MPIDEELVRRILERYRAAERERQRRQAEARRPPTVAERIYGKVPVDGQVQRLRSIDAGKVKRRK
jgi:hypothetical protein